MIDERLFSLHREQVTIDPVHHFAFANYKTAAHVLRLDKIHPVMSGNKWFKLKLYLNEIMEGHYEEVVTWGGPFSNHIVSTAYACQSLNLRSVGLIRGETGVQSSHTLLEAANCGMKLEFIHRDQYAKKDSETSWEEIRQKYPGAYVIPEGGAGPLGIQGAADIMNWIKKGNYTDILCAIGTGTMFKGLLHHLERGQRLTGISILKVAMDRRDEFSQKLGTQAGHCHSHVLYDYHWGGYAKKQPALLSFMNNFYDETGIPTDFVYTGKLFFAGSDLATKKYFDPASRLLFIHSGGLQGNLSLPPGTLAF
jgi:1-aminocyclopropane-1-carboxylate deaminase